MKLVTHGADIVGRVEALQAQLTQAMADLDHLDAAIRLFELDIELEELPTKPVPPPNAAFRGEVQRFLLHMLRTSPTALTTHELGDAVMKARGLNLSDKRLRRLISQRTGHLLGKLRSRGFVQSEKAEGGGLL